MEKRVRFEERYCKSCSLCVAVCPRKIIKISERLNGLGYHPATVADEDQEKCTSCALCARMCPDAVIEVYR